VVRDDGSLKMADLKTEWQVLVEHYIGVVVVVAAGLVFAVVMLCAGIIFCCCRRCGHCGARKQPFDNRRDPCKRITLGIILAVICIIIL
jgi:prominin 1